MKLFSILNNMWTNFLSNSEELKIHFNPLPDLTHVELMSIELMSYSTDMQILLDLEVYPQNPPKEWEGRNTMQVELSILQPQSIEISGWRYPMRGKLSAVEKGGFIEMKFESKQGKLKWKTPKSIHINNVHAYSKAKTD